MFTAIKMLLWTGFLGGLNICFLGVIALSVVYQKLPSLEALEEYRPRLPMRIYSAEGNLLAEFGEEKRHYRQYHEFPHELISALLATEDVRFFQHPGLDWVGIGRAAVGWLQGRREGASTITMQVARNFYFTRDRSLLRKVCEALLALEIEEQFTKQEILERYMNQIYLGQGSFGFAAAARAYYDKSLSELNTAEIAVLAGLPKAPSRYDPRRHRSAAKERQTHVLRRMREADIINDGEYEELVLQPLPPTRKTAYLHYGEAAFAAEEVRQLVFEHFGNAAYERGLNIYTTIQSRLQRSAVRAVRQGLLAHEARRKYLGPEKFLDTRSFDEAVTALRQERIIGGLQPAIVLKATQKSLAVVGKDGERYVIAGARLGTAKDYLPGGRKKPALVAGALVRLAGAGEKTRLVSLPGAEAALVVLSPDDGAVLAMVGGFDFARSQFNHVTQARRQPGSAIKPFVYSAALEKGFTPVSKLPDTPIFLSAQETGSGASWQPKNYDGKAEGPILLRRALTKSKNLATVQLLKFIGVDYAQDYLLRFGFRREDHPAYLTMGLGAGVATPMEMVRAYAAFANGGYRVNQYLITRVEDYDGNLIVNELDFESRRQIIDPRNAFIMTSLLQSVAREGTGVATWRQLGRVDVAGKTGTTNNLVDAWFAGYGGNLVAVAWIGYDQVRSLGRGETGSRAALPIWTAFMAKALAHTPEVEYLQPPNIIAADIDRDSGRLLSAGEEAEKMRLEYFYQEFLPAAKAPPPAVREERELF